MDADLAAIAASAQAAVPPQLNVVLDCQKQQDWRNRLATLDAQKATDQANAAKAAAAVSTMASPVEQEQELYLKLVELALGARMQWIQPGQFGTYLLTSACTDSLAAAKLMYPVVKANYDLISQGLPPA